MCIEALFLQAMKKGLLVLLRHGESVWNAEGRFAGASDVPLSPLGKGQAMAAGMLLRNYTFDVVYTSTMQRAVQTWELMASSFQSLPAWQSFEWLNERDFGLLEGQLKSDLEAQFSAEQVERWRFGWDEPLPEGSGETFVRMRERVLPQFDIQIRPLLHADKKVLVVAHGQVLRSIAMYLENAPADEAQIFSMDNARPRAYHCTEGLFDRVEV